MKEQVEARIKELKIEFEEGKKMLDEIDMKRSSLGQAILRISGAVQALEELVSEGAKTENEADA